MNILDFVVGLFVVSALSCDGSAVQNLQVKPEGEALGQGTHLHEHLVVLEQVGAEVAYCEEEVGGVGN